MFFEPSARSKYSTSVSTDEEVTMKRVTLLSWKPWESLKMGSWEEGRW